MFNNFARYMLALLPRRSRLFALCISVFAASLLNSVLLHADTAKRDIIYKVDLNIQVISDEAERDKLLAQAEKMGGYFIRNATHSMQLRIPAEKLTPFVDFVRAHWRIYDQQYETQNVGDELIHKQSELAVKTDLLKQYQQLIAKTQQTEYFTVVKAASSLVSQIERIKGRIAFLKRSSQFALVNLQLAEPVRPAMKQTSTFDWINQIGLTQLMQNHFLTIDRNAE